MQRVLLALWMGIGGVGCALDAEEDLAIGTEARDVIVYSPQMTFEDLRHDQESRFWPVTLTTSVVAGQRYRLRTKVQLEAPSEKTYVMAYAGCAMASNPTQILRSLTLGEDVYADETLYLYPRFVWTAPSSGSAICRLQLVLTTGNNGTNGEGVITLSAASYVENIPVPAGSESLKEPVSRRLVAGQAVDIAVDDDFTIPDLSRPVAISGDVSWTVCRPYDHDDFPDFPDNTICKSDDPDPSAATIQTQISVFQRGPAGQEWCYQWNANNPVKSTATDRHHGVIYGGGSFTPNPACGTSARVKIWVKNAAGDPVALGANHSIMAAIPAD